MRPLRPPLSFIAPSFHLLLARLLPPPPATSSHLPLFCERMMKLEFILFQFNLFLPVYIFSLLGPTKLLPPSPSFFPHLFSLLKISTSSFFLFCSFTFIYLLTPCFFSSFVLSLFLRSLLFFVQLSSSISVHPLQPFTSPTHSHLFTPPPSPFLHLSLPLLLLISPLSHPLFRPSSSPPQFSLLIFFFFSSFVYSPLFLPSFLSPSSFVLLPLLSCRSFLP